MYINIFYTKQVCKILYLFIYHRNNVILFDVTYYICARNHTLHNAFTLALLCFYYICVRNRTLHILYLRNHTVQNFLGACTNYIVITHYIILNINDENTPRVLLL